MRETHKIHVVSDRSYRSFRDGNDCNIKNNTSTCIATVLLCSGHVHRILYLVESFDYQCMVLERYPTNSHHVPAIHVVPAIQVPRTYIGNPMSNQASSLVTKKKNATQLMNWQRNKSLPCLLLLNQIQHLKYNSILTPHNSIFSNMPQVTLGFLQTPTCLFL